MIFGQALEVLKADRKVARRDGNYCKSKLHKKKEESDRKNEF